MNYKTYDDFIDTLKRRYSIEIKDYNRNKEVGKYLKYYIEEK